MISRLVKKNYIALLTVRLLLGTYIINIQKEHCRSILDVLFRISDTGTRDLLNLHVAILLWVGSNQLERS
jgi:hypothetical protein